MHISKVVNYCCYVLPLMLIVILSSLSLYFLHANWKYLAQSNAASNAATETQNAAIEAQMAQIQEEKGGDSSSQYAELSNQLSNISPPISRPNGRYVTQSLLLIAAFGLFLYHLTAEQNETGIYSTAVQVAYILFFALVVLNTTISLLGSNGILTGALSFNSSYLSNVSNNVLTQWQIGGIVNLLNLFLLGLFGFCMFVVNSILLCESKR